jgi:DHA3 family multidrug efflux protein-like MFS transporter
MSDVATLEEVMADADAGKPVRAPMPHAFRQLLLNTLATGVTSSFLWFALTFWVYIETRSVVTTGVIGGAYSVSSALLSPFIGTYVDRHRKRRVLLVLTAVALVCFGLATAVYAIVGPDDLLRLTSPFFWLLVATTLLGSVAASSRGIALSTCVTLLVPDESRDRANGMVGTVTGISFAITSVFSGLVIGFLGMGWAYVGALVLIAVALAHMSTIHFDEPAPAPPPRDGQRQKSFDVRTAVGAVREVPGLKMLIFLAAFNNLLGGVFMALMDAYGLELVSVETWGFIWGGISMSFIAGGLVVAKKGLGRKPLRLLLAGNLVNWAVCSVFAVRSSIVLVTVGMIVWLAMIPVIEAAEQTILQRAIPFEKQGRVFGFAQMIENAAAPVTAFMIAPIAETVFMPTMTDGRGAELIGDWFGTGPARGMALMFTIAGLIGVVVTALAWTSKSYRRLSAAAAAATEAEAAPATV